MGWVACPGVDRAFIAPPQLRKLELHDLPVSDEGLLAHKEQLVGLSLRDGSQVLCQLPHLQSLMLGRGHHLSRPITELLQQTPPLQDLRVVLPGVAQDVAPGRPMVLQHYKGLSALQRLSVEVPPSAVVECQELCALGQLQQLQLKFQYSHQAPDHRAWAQALAGLTNLEVLSVPIDVTACGDLWLTGLTRLAVLDVTRPVGQPALTSAAANIGCLLAPHAGSSSSSTGGGRGSSGMQPTSAQVQVVCLSTGLRQLYHALVAAVPVLLANKHLFLESWEALQECGVELWPAPVAARLRQLLAV